MPTASKEELRAVVRQHVIATYLHGEKAHGLEDDSPLYIDSIDFVSLVSFIEDRFSIEFMPREIDRRTFQSVAQIEEAIRRKLEQKNSA